MKITAKRVIYGVLGALIITASIGSGGLYLLLDWSSARSIGSATSQTIILALGIWGIFYALYGYKEESGN